MKPASFITDPKVSRSILSFSQDHGLQHRADEIIVEEPLEIRLNSKTITITMRTPGEDFALAIGFLLSEGVIRTMDDVAAIRFCGPRLETQSTTNIVRVELQPSVKVDALRLDRHFYASSSCGVCGKASLEALAIHAKPFAPSGLKLRPEIICALPSRLRQSQVLFHRTGSLHAAGLFDAEGTFICAHEDVGRHNAVDKLIGQRVISEQAFDANHVMCISGRGSFEILQKAIVAGIQTIVAVGAPSSLAVDLAERFNLTLIGFTSAERFNVYAGMKNFQVA